jgi:hypothetical protein
MSNNEHVTVECDLKIKSNYEAVGLYMESNCTLAENNTRPVAKILDDEQTVIQVQQDAVHEGKYVLYDIWIVRCSVLLYLVS